MRDVKQVVEIAMYWIAAERARAVIRHAVVCSNVTGNQKEDS